MSKAFLPVPTIHCEELVSLGSSRADERLAGARMTRRTREAAHLESRSDIDRMANALH